MIFFFLCGLTRLRHDSFSEGTGSLTFRALNVNDGSQSTQLGTKPGAGLPELMSCYWVRMVHNLQHAISRTWP